MSGVGKKAVLLFPEEEDSSDVNDPEVKERINKYLEKQASSQKMCLSHGGDVKGKEDEHTGITDDEGEDEGDYDLFGRQTLKASSAAMVECMKEAKKIHDKELKEEKKMKK